MVMGSSPAKTHLYEEFAASGKALSHASRLELLDLLSQAERSVEALARAAGLNLTTASSHLQVLKQSGFVETRREGVKIYYRSAGDDVAQLLVLLRTVADRRRAQVSAARDTYLGGRRASASRVTSCGPVLTTGTTTRVWWCSMSGPARSFSPDTSPAPSRYRSMNSPTASPNYPPTPTSSSTAAVSTAGTRTTPSGP